MPRRRGAFGGLPKRRPRGVHIEEELDGDAWPRGEDLYAVLGARCSARVRGIRAARAYASHRQCRAAAARVLLSDWPPLVLPCLPCTCACWHLVLCLKRSPPSTCVPGLARDASADDIKRAYRRAALNLHPDKTGGDASAAAEFQRVGFAYSVLSDPRKKRYYDETGARRLMHPVVLRRSA